MGLEVYYPTDIRNALLAAEQAVNATVLMLPAIKTTPSPPAFSPATGLRSPHWPSPSAWLPGLRLPRRNGTQFSCLLLHHSLGAAGGSQQGHSCLMEVDDGKGQESAAKRSHCPGSH